MSLFDLVRRESNLGGYFYAPNTVNIESFNIGADTKIWNYSHISRGVSIGKNCIVGEGVHIGPNVIIGNNCKIGNHAQIFEGVSVGDNCFIGPCVCFTNDRVPKINEYWEIVETYICNNVSIGANSTIVCGAHIGEDTLIGAGSLVPGRFHNVLKGRVYFGNPCKDMEGRFEK